MKKHGNLLANVPALLPEELFETLLESSHVTIKRIVSKGHISPKDFWYDQNQNEFVLVVQGAARLLFEHDKQLVSLEVGDYINIPAHQKHRVEWTDPKVETTWLAIFY